MAAKAGQKVSQAGQKVSQAGQKVSQAGQTAFRMSVRRWILTGGIAAIAITGSIYGARLKGDFEVVRERKRLLQLGPEEQIAQLDATKADLVLRKNELERKLKQVQRRRVEKEEEERVKREGLAQQTETEKREDLYSVEGRENMFRERWKKWLKW